jgi:tetratricopeptide (TPR) repeat protein
MNETSPRWLRVDGRLRLRRPGAFFGRSEELVAIDRATSEARVVSVLGPPGVGKTRVALELAVRCEPRWPGGVLGIDASQASDEAGLVLAFAAALGAVGPRGPESAEARLSRVTAAARARGPILVVLDDLDRMPIAEAARFVTKILESTEGVHVLSTSRIRLGLPAEVIFDLRPLPVSDARGGSSDAARMFAARAGLREIGHDVEILVRRLEGLPLAIEVVAARVRGHEGGVAAVLAEGPSAGAALEGALDDSWARLDDRARHLLIACASFLHGFPIDVVADAAGLPLAEAEETLEALVDASLALAEPMPGGEPFRFALLDAVRGFAARKAPRAGFDPERAFVDAYVRRAHVIVADAGSWLPTPTRAWIRRELPNLRRALARLQNEEPARTTDALALAVTIDAAVEEHGPHEARIELLGRALSAISADEASPLLVARAELALADASIVLGREGGSEAIERAERLAERIDDDLVAAAIHQQCGEGFAMVGQWSAAEATLVRGRQRLPEGAPSPLVARLMSVAAMTELQVGSIDEACALYARAAAHAAPHERVTIETRWAMALGQRGRDGEARAILERVRDELPDTTQQRAAHLKNLSRIAAAIGDLDDAARFAEGAVEAWSTARSEVGIAHTRWIQALVALFRGDLPQAEAFGREAAVLLERHRAPGAATAIALLASVAALAGDHEKAASELARASATDLRGLLWHRSLIDAHAALVAHARGDDETSRAIAERLRNDPWPGDRLAAVDRSQDVRAVLRLAEVRPRSHRSMVVEANGAWFETEGRRVDLALRPFLKRLLAALVLAHRTGDGWISSDALVAAGWPGERLGRRVGGARLRVAISTMRKLGLRDALRHGARGYRLVDSIEVAGSSTTTTPSRK